MDQLSKAARLMPSPDHIFAMVDCNCPAGRICHPNIHKDTCPVHREWMDHAIAAGQATDTKSLRGGL